LVKNRFSSWKRSLDYRMVGRAYGVSVSAC
jgi:hypothetical protein